MEKPGLSRLPHKQKNTVFKSSRRYQFIMKLKVWPQCGEEKSSSYFYNYKNTPDGLSPRCKACTYYHKVKKPYIKTNAMSPEEISKRMTELLKKVDEERIQKYENNLYNKWHSDIFGGDDE